MILKAVLQPECRGNLKEIGERLPVLNIRLLQFAVNDYMCIIIIKKKSWMNEIEEGKKEKINWKEKGEKAELQIHLRKRKDAWKTSLSVKKGTKEHDGKNDSSDIQLVMRRVLGDPGMLGGQNSTQISWGSKTSESCTKPIFLSDMVWDISQLVPCIQLKPWRERNGIEREWNEIKREMEWKDWEGGRT